MRVAAHGDSIADLALEVSWAEDLRENGYHAASALVVLQPCKGDRLAPQRVHQVRVEPVVLG